MTYAGFLLLFVVIPIVLLAAVHLWDRRRGILLPKPFRTYPVWIPLVLHVFLALAYTTPWDNYLVATRVWWYNPELVTGLTIGWVPVEEYSFFILQSVLTGLLLVALMRRLPVNPRPAADCRSARWVSTGLLALLWLPSVVVLFSGWPPGTYLSIQLAWALLPLMTQTAFGGDILWRHRKAVGLTLGSVTLYLALADTLAIGEGIWAIDPAQSLPLLLGGVLPLEEFTFFLLTNTLLTFGITLLLARESHERLPQWFKRRFGRLLPPEREAGPS